MFSIDFVQKEMDWKTVKFSSCGVFLDFGKALDTVMKHDVLLTKRDFCGIRGVRIDLFFIFHI